MFLKILTFLVLFFSSVYGGYIVVSPYSEEALQQYDTLVATDPVLAEIAKKEQVQIEKFGIELQEYLKTSSFKKDENLALFYIHLKSSFPDAFIVNKPFVAVVKQMVPVNIPTPVAEEDDYTIWIALFGLALIALFALYLSSEEIKVVKEEHEKMQKKQEEIIEIQNKILTSMSENIHNIAAQAAKETKELVLSTDQNEKLEKALKKVAQSENRLLDITTDLLEFLRIKSNKITIINEPFGLVNLLNDITGQVSVTDRHIDFDLLYNVEKNVPATLVGDTLHLSKVAVNIIDYFKQNGAKSVVVSIKKEGVIGVPKIVIEFQSDLVFDIENDETLFISRYNEETNQYDGLNLYVAKELSLKMDAELYAKNKEDNTASFIFVMEYKKAPLTELLSHSKPVAKELESLNILLVDKNETCLEIDTKVFQKLNLFPHTFVRRKFNHNHVDFSQYKVVIIDEAILTTELIHKLSQYKDLKVLSISSIFVESQYKAILDAELKRPLTTIQLQDTLVGLYKEKESSSKEKPLTTIQVYKEQFPDTPNVTLESFKDFSGAKLLIVEDNFINQKVLLSVLKQSDMEIDIANNGQEAVDMMMQKEYDLVLMDINMPVMDGYSATLKIRQLGKHDLAIVALSALTSKDEINRMFEVGMNGYLAKPFYKERLYSVFAMFIGKKETPIATQELHQEKEIPKLEALDIAKGLENAKHSEMFYKEILQEFKDAFGESAELFERLCEEMRYEQLRMLVVDIRGLSGAIGATHLHELSIEILQMILFKKYDIVKDYAKRFASEMEKLNHDIEIYLAS